MNIKNLIIILSLLTSCNVKSEFPYYALIATVMTMTASATWIGYTYSIITIEEQQRTITKLNKIVNDQEKIIAGNSTKN